MRAAAGRNGLDYVEVGDDPTIAARLLPRQAAARAGGRPPGPARDYLRDRRRRRASPACEILDVDPQVDADPERDDYLVITLDRDGDLSRYTLRLVGVEGIDPHYASADFSFRIDCAERPRLQAGVRLRARRRWTSRASTIWPRTTRAFAS